MTTKKNYLEHHGILGQKWGIRRFQNYDGSYTPAGLARYGRLPKNTSIVTDSDRQKVVRALKYPKLKSVDNLYAQKLQADRLNKRVRKLRTVFKNNKRLNQAYINYRHKKNELYNQYEKYSKELSNIHDEVYDDFHRLPLKQKKEYYKPYFDETNKAQGLPTSIQQIEKMSDSEVDNACYNILGLNRVKDSRKTLIQYIHDEYDKLEPWDDVMEDIWSGAYFGGRLPSDSYFDDNKEKYNKLYGSVITNAEKGMSDVSIRIDTLNKEFTEEVLGDLSNTPITSVFSNGSTMETILSQDLLDNLYY